LTRLANASTLNFFSYIGGLAAAAVVKDADDSNGNDAPTGLTSAADTVVSSLSRALATAGTAVLILILAVDAFALFRARRDRAVAAAVVANIIDDNIVTLLCHLNRDLVAIYAKSFCARGGGPFLNKNSCDITGDHPNYLAIPVGVFWVRKCRALLTN